MVRRRSEIKTTESTRYEVALTRGSKILYIYGYTSRRSKEGLLAMATDDVTALLTADELAESDNFRAKYTRKTGIQITSGLFIRFTGATERMAATPDQDCP
jgi:hypothetical protein